MNNNRTGFTLTEMMFVMALFVGIGGAVLVLAKSGATFWGATDAQLTTLANAQRAVDRLREELAAARQDGLACNADGTTVTFNSFAGTPIIYAVAEGSLIRTQAGVAQVVASGIVVSANPLEAPIKCLPNNVVEVTLRVSNPALAQPAIQSQNTLTARVWVRNPALAAP